MRPPWRAWPRHLMCPTPPTRSRPCFQSLPGTKLQPSPWDLKPKPGNRASDLKRGKPGVLPCLARWKKSRRRVICWLEQLGMAHSGIA